MSATISAQRPCFESALSSGWSPSHPYGSSGAAYAGVER